jgi:hypothetical protein
MKPIGNALIAALLLGTPGTAPARKTGAIDADRVRAHEAFLAGETLRGRASATRDEAIAAAYVAAQFQAAGLTTAPGMTGYTQTVPLVRQKSVGAPMLTVAGTRIDGVALIRASGGTVSGQAAIVADASLPPPEATILVIGGGRMPPGRFIRAAEANGTALIIVAETERTRRLRLQSGGSGLPIYPIDGAPGSQASMVTVPAESIATLTATPGARVTLAVPFELEATATTNSVAYLPGTDPGAGVLLLLAHLDHLGQRADGKIMHGANDDASGLVALMELARALASAKPMRRGILFVAYGSEEIGGFGAKHFAANPPVPLARMVANIQFEMIGEQDPKLPRDTMMMTGYERSTLGALLRAQGAQIAPDPYPEQNFFRRSDNYALALKGVVAHTVSGRVGANYHQPTDTIENMDFPFMISAIASMVAPIRQLANARAVPTWTPGGRPTE